MIKKKEKLKIEIEQWSHSCGDGCCLTYGTTTTVNGVEMPLDNEDTGTIVEMILQHLGYEVEVNSY